ncbi:MAG: hypothetical protein O7G85_00170 [Planctomycetota bacterium]|nr:hypothetical protein [Planctomycetota bacterium]
MTTKGNDADFVSAFVRTMDWADRCLLMLFYAEGLSTDEISQVLDQPEHRIADRLKLIRERVKGAMDHPVLA